MQKLPAWKWTLESQNVAKLSTDWGPPIRQNSAKLGAFGGNCSGVRMQTILQLAALHVHLETEGTQANLCQKTGMARKKSFLTAT